MIVNIHYININQVVLPDTVQRSENVIMNIIEDQYSLLSAIFNLTLIITIFKAPLDL